MKRELELTYLEMNTGQQKISFLQAALACSLQQAAGQAALGHEVELCISLREDCTPLFCPVLPIKLLEMSLLICRR